MGTLYLVATPIGNLEDISQRALRVLGQVGLIAAEDTRQTRKLLARYQIGTPLTSYHEHNKLTKLTQVLEGLNQGDVALVSDAGTPALNDPGYELVRAALAAGYPVSPIPGPSAPVAALVASGLPTNAFLYLGYLPRKASERQRLLEEVTGIPYTLIFLEAPHRLLESLKDIQHSLGDRSIAIARELTKVHEEILRERLSAAILYFSEHPPRGEFTLVISGAPTGDQRWSEDQLQARILELVQAGMGPSQIASQIAIQAGWPKKAIYQRVLAITPRSEPDE